MALEALIIGWDGATFSLLDPLVRKGVMPNLKEALERGTRRVLRSIIPPLTPPAWTSVITGRTPGYHGIFDFFQKQSPDSIHLRPSQSQNVRAETLWAMVNRWGRRATALNFPVTFPPPPINGYVISGGWLTLRQLRLACHPEGLYENIRAIDGMNLRELVMDLSEEERALEGCSEEERIDFVGKHIRRDRQWAKVLFHLLDTDPTELVSIVFDGTDKIQHLCWPELAAYAGNSGKADVRNGLLQICLDYYRELDRILGELIHRMNARTNLFLVSDHGFGESWDLFFVNQWLSDKGCLAWKETQRPMAADGKALGMRHLARHTFEIDWERTQAFAATPSSNGIHLAPERTRNLSEQERQTLLRSLVQDLMEVRSPTTGNPLVTKVWKREEAYPGPCGNLGPDLTLALWDGGLLSILASDCAVRRRHAALGAHRPEGIFVGLGPAFPSGVVPELSLLDVAPIVLHTLGLPAPASLEGKCSPQVLAGEFKTRGPRIETIETEPIYGTPAGKEAQPIYTEEDEKTIADRLRQLGYLE